MGGILTFFSREPDPPRHANTGGVQEAPPASSYDTDTTARVAPRDTTYSYSNATAKITARVAPRVASSETNSSSSSTTSYAAALRKSVKTQPQEAPRSTSAGCTWRKEPPWQFRCPRCFWSWSTHNWTSQQGKQCGVCSTMLYPLNKKYPEGRGLTPYQGPDCQLGEFECPRCQRRWMSTHSWADKGQQCRSCKINVLPFKQTSLETAINKSDPTKHHHQELCEKCKELGGFCGWSRPIPSKRTS